MTRPALLLMSVILAATGVACSGGPRTVVAEFEDVGDLVVRANVQQSDAVVGSVDSIDLIERDDVWLAQVTMSVADDAILTDGIGAVVRSTSLLGEKYVDLVPPKEPGRDIVGGVSIPVERTAKAPELEAVFSQLGGLLASGGLEDLARITTASAMILEGQEAAVGRVLDGTAKLVSSLHSQRGALAGALDELAEASGTLDGRASTLERALDVSDDALRLVASQRTELEELVVQLDRLGAPLARLTRAHQGDVSEQIEILNEVIPIVHGVRDTVAAAVEKLPAFTELFARAIPGDHIQLDVFIESFPVGTPTSSAGPMSLRDFFLEVTR